MASTPSTALPMRSIQMDQSPEGKLSLKLDILPHIRINTTLQDHKVGKDSCRDMLGVDPEHVRNGKDCDNPECETPKSKEHMIIQVPVCPPAPRKSRPKRKRQSPSPETFFTPPDLHLLPKHIKALFN